MLALLALTATLLGLLLAAIASGAGTGTATPHPEHGSMLRGTGGGRLGAPGWAGLAAGLLTLGIMWAALRIGFARPRWVRIAIDVGMAGYAAVFLALLRASEAYEAGETIVVGGFTEPVAWLVYGLGLSPWILLLLVVWRFDEVCYGPRERARFEAILTRSRAEMIAEAGGESPDDPAPFPDEPRARPRP